MSNDLVRRVEINGIKFDIDLRTAVRIDTLRVGSRVKCLVKKYNDHKVYPGVVIGFEPFTTLPTVVVAYVSESYDTHGLLEFRAFNAKTEDFEIVADVDNNSLEVNKATIVSKFNKDIEKAKDAVAELERRKMFFLEHFGQYFADATPEQQNTLQISGLDKPAEVNYLSEVSVPNNDDLPF